MEEFLTIKHVINEGKGHFEARRDGKDAGLMTYVKAGENRIIIDHTEVDDEFSGLGIGKAMVEEAVNFARENNLKIMPLCPFAKALLKRNLSFADVLYKP